MYIGPFVAPIVVIAIMIIGIVYILNWSRE